MSTRSAYCTLSSILIEADRRLPDLGMHRGICQDRQRCSWRGSRLNIKCMWEAKGQAAPNYTHKTHDSREKKGNRSRREATKLHCLWAVNSQYLLLQYMLCTPGAFYICFILTAARLQGCKCLITESKMNGKHRLVSFINNEQKIFRVSCPLNESVPPALICKLLSVKLREPTCCDVKHQQC